uniref:protein NRT1/ PTR FAMILY 2.7-like n=1 Tax=Fragaria vesca subsp. vesca TaxID=101020 RepID=UPI0005C9726E|nr:PREDICTED: protein NRT1/ PTR FAMILY 2.7-like [Fragaria vesca subsp. vesca]
MIMLTIIATIPSLMPSPCSIGSLITCQAPSKFQYSVLYAALSLASLGLGGTRFTIATMGAEQFNDLNDQGIFFNWYFLALYVANIFSFTAIIYIQDNVGWGLGFGICCIANGVGLVVFLLGKRFYKKVKPKGSPFLSIARVLVAAIWKRKMSSANSTENDYYYEAGVLADSAPPTKSFRSDKIILNYQLINFLNCAALKIEQVKQFEGSHGNSWTLCTVREVEDLKALIKIMPLWSTGIFLSTPIGIFSSLTVLQALTMDRHLGPHFKIPAASIIVFNLLATAISIFIIDRFILRKYKNLTGRTLTPIKQIGTGHIINIIALIASALIERKRLGVVRAHSLMNQPGSVVPMSAFWLVAQLSLIGIAEGFHFPGQVSLCYQEFPKSLRSTSTAMISLLIGIGYYLSTAVTDLVDRTTNWLPDDINQGRLDNVFWMLVVICVVNFGYFITCAKFFVYQNQNVGK